MKSRQARRQARVRGTEGVVHELQEREAIAVFNRSTPTRTRCRSRSWRRRKRRLTDAFQTGELGYPMMNAQREFWTRSSTRSSPPKKRFVWQPSALPRGHGRERGAARTDHEGDGYDAVDLPGQHYRRPGPSPRADRVAGHERDRRHVGGGGRSSRWRNSSPTRTKCGSLSQAAPGDGHGTAQLRTRPDDECCGSSAASNHPPSVGRSAAISHPYANRSSATRAKRRRGAGTRRES